MFDLCKKKKKFKIKIKKRIIKSVFVYLICLICSLRFLD